MVAMPSEQMLQWAANSVATGAKVVSVESLHSGYSPWLLHVESDGEARVVILRALVAGRMVSRTQLATGAAALLVAAELGLTAPRSLARDLDGRGAGAPATLETVVPGISVSPPMVSADRLRTAGAAIAKLHKVPLQPQPDLPLRIRSLQGPAQLDEYGLVRRWATLHDAVADRRKSDVVEGLCALTGWSVGRAHEVLRSTYSTPLLQRADDMLRAIPVPQGETVLVHADLWAGNMVWNGDTDVTFVDWKDAGVGHAGVDLGHLRLMMTLQYGPDAATHILDGWQEEMGREAADLPYWDVVAAVHTQTNLNDQNCEPGFDADGNKVSYEAITERRDAFLRDALDRLNSDPTCRQYLVVNIP